LKFPAISLLLLVLSGTLIAQSAPPNFPPQITHVVVIVQENRSPDNLFHFLSPLCPIPANATGLNACIPSPVTSSCYDISPCGLSNQSGSVKPITLTPLPINGSTDPNHSHTAFEQMCDPDPGNGFICRNDGAWQIKQTNKAQTSYVYVDNPAVKNFDGTDGHLLDPYLTLAEQYGWANYMYQTNQGASYPAHQYLFSGTSARTTAEDLQSTFISGNFTPQSNDVGCLAPPNTTTTLISPLLGPVGSGCVKFDNKSVKECNLPNSSLVYPSNPVGSFCTNKPNLGGALDTQRVTWKYYAPSAGSIWTAPNSIKNICVPQFTSPTTLTCSGGKWKTNVDIANKGTDILGDITGCKLSSVSWVIPNGGWSDHAGTTDVYGPSWVAAVINTIGQNPQCPAKTKDAGQTYWENTAILVTWDDWGGWSDNQPPPHLGGLPCTSSNCQGDYQYGFRVPLLVVSAYTPKGYINNDILDFGSLIRMIEGVYGIPQGALGVADARATTDLHDFFTGAFRPYTPVPALKDPSFFFGKTAQAGLATPPDNDGDED